MKIKVTAILSTASVILLTCLFIMAQLAKREGYQNLLLVTPSGLGVQTHEPKKLQEFSDEEFLLTYEIKDTAMAQAVSSKHSVTLVGTNHNYAGIMGYLTLDGGFFTESAWDAKNKHAVLNETAAFELFGSKNISGRQLKLNNEAWIVTGVISDNDTENANIYVPSSVTGGRAKSLMVLLDEQNVTEAYAKNALKSLGVHDNAYDFINLSKAASAFGERFSVALKSALLAISLILALQAGKRLIQWLRFYQDSLSQIYFRELLSRHRADLAKTTLSLLLFAAGIVGTLVLSLQILASCLTWQDISLITGGLTSGDFGARLIWLEDYQWLDIILFAGCTGAILTLLVLYILRHIMKAGAVK